MRTTAKQLGQLAILGLAIPSPVYAASNDGLDDARVLVGGNVNLRVMPLGASITRGKGSEDENGYREDLRNLLVADGNDVNMVGSRASGNMSDNQHEGWDGLRIDEVFEKAQDSVPKWLPNIITINAGTNDCAQDYDIGNASDRMAEMLEYLWKASPKASIILSTLLVNSDGDVEKRVLEVNTQLKTLSEEMTAKSRKLILVDMHSTDGPQESDLVDGTHPREEGYDKMAKIWFQGIQDAASRGWLESPQDIDEEETSATSPSATTTPSSSNTTTGRNDASATNTASANTSGGAASTPGSASATQSSKEGGGSKAHQHGYPALALILALGTLVVFL